MPPRSARTSSARSLSARAGSAFDTALLGLSVLTSLVFVLLPGELRDRAAGTLRRTAVAPLAELQRWAEEKRAAIAGYDARVRAHTDTAATVSDARALRAENAQLRRMLGLAARVQWGFVNAEAIPNELPSELVGKQVVLTFMLTQGGRAGITPFTPVVAPQGLVGMVQTVDPAMSIAITYSHPDFRVSAMTPDQAAFGIVQPHLGTGAERGLLEMRGVPFRTPLKAGQLVVSSGLGATYPRGIAVGRIIREIQTPEKWARTYLLDPAVPLAEVGPVMLLRKQRADQGVDSVWTSVPASDSASRAVAAAGDSVARAAALREALARRAAFDSLVADSLRRDSVLSARGVAPATGESGAPPGAGAPTTPGAPIPGAPTPGAPTTGAPAPPGPSARPAAPPTRRPAAAGAAAPGTAAPRAATRPDSAPARPRAGTPQPDSAAEPATPARPTVPPPARNR